MCVPPVCGAQSDGFTLSGSWTALNRSGSLSAAAGANADRIAMELSVAPPSERVALTRLLSSTLPLSLLLQMLLPILPPNASGVAPTLSFHCPTITSQDRSQTFTMSGVPFPSLLSPSLDPSFSLESGECCELSRAEPRPQTHFGIFWSQERFWRHCFCSFSGDEIVAIDYSLLSVQTCEICAKNLSPFLGLIP